MDRMKPCPFCGGKAHVHEHERFGVECDDCGMGLGCIKETEGEAVESWNKRTDAVARGVVDQIRWERDFAIKQLEEHGVPFGGIAQDVVKVVRCKDCKHWHEGTAWCDQHSYFDEDEWNMFDADDFCSYGERKDND